MYARGIYNPQNGAIVLVIRLSSPDIILDELRKTTLFYFSFIFTRNGLDLLKASALPIQSFVLAYDLPLLQGLMGSSACSSAKPLSLRLLALGMLILFITAPCFIAKDIIIITREYIRVYIRTYVSVYGCISVRVILCLIADVCVCARVCLFTCGRVCLHEHACMWKSVYASVHVFQPWASGGKRTYNCISQAHISFPSSCQTSPLAHSRVLATGLSSLISPAPIIFLLFTLKHSPPLYTVHPLPCPQTSTALAPPFGTQSPPTSSTQNSILFAFVPRL